MTSKLYRGDIQVLRGLAVLLVVFYHAKIGGLAAGYLGVDIFYVISGFLITGLIARQHDNGNFSFVRFYVSRARRLLPAAYMVYFASAIGAYFLLTGVEYDRFQQTLVGAITFTANFDLWQHTNYFSPAAKLNPLTHTWSLSIEEQYYLLLPAVLFFVPRRFWIAGTVFMLFASLLLCLYLATISPAATFYMLSTRAWELAVGSLIALTGLQVSLTKTALLPVKYLVMACLVLVPAFAPGLVLGSVHPGLDSILVSIATGFFLIVRTRFLEDGILAKVLKRIGDISYSLYLVHWPVFSFASNAYLGNSPPIEVRVALLIISLMLAYAIFRLVESPTRRIAISRTLGATAAVVMASLAIIMFSNWLQVARLDKDYLAIRGWNSGFDQVCNQKGLFMELRSCQSSGTPKMLVWGDSFAMHLVPGLANGHLGVIQATRDSCGPVLNVAVIRSRLGYLRQWSESCIGFNQSVIKYLATRPEIEVVVLSSLFQYYLAPDAHGIRFKDGKNVHVRFSEAIIVEGLLQTIRAIQSLGKRVIIIGPTPTSGHNIGLCLERKDAGLLILGENFNCAIRQIDVENHRKKILLMLSSVSNQSGDIVLNLIDLLCRNKTCPTQIENTFLYSDHHHITVAGSKAIAEKYDLVEHVLAKAK